MLSHIRQNTLATLTLVISGAVASAAASSTELVDRALHGGVGDGTLSAGVNALEEHLANQPEDDLVRFALGMGQFLQSGEALFQSLYKYGAYDQGRNQYLTMGMMMRPVPLLTNPDPQPVSHADLRNVVMQWIEDVRIAEQTLRGIDDPDLKLRVRVGMIRMDFNSDGVALEEEELWRIFNALRTRFRATDETAEVFDIAFDRGDVEWLRGYCHLCMAAGEMILAHDMEKLFDCCAHLFFTRPETPNDFLMSFNVDPDLAREANIIDLIAMFHLLSFEVAEPKRMEAAREHLIEAVARSRDMWGHYMKETDNDREWLPNPRQGSVIGEATITQTQVDAWLMALGEAEALLQGRKVLRFWRGDGTRGINIRRVFAEPTRFDLVLWIQGSAAAPYLEQGEFTQPNLWRDLQDAFDRRFFRNMFWMN